MAYLITSEAAFVVYNYFEPIRVLQQLYARRPTKVPVRIVAVPKG